jgi:hypothetical protein
MTTRTVSAWRSISFIRIGCMMGARLVGSVSAQVRLSARAIAPAATYSRMASCTGLAFHPID